MDWHSEDLFTGYFNKNVLSLRFVIYPSSLKKFPQSYIDKKSASFDPSWVNADRIRLKEKRFAFGVFWDRCFLFFKGCPGWGAKPGPLNFIYFLIFTTLPLSHSGSPLWDRCLILKISSPKKLREIFCSKYW
jgi:hypothetical protein